ncbi:MAG TPA: hypothetical protein IAA06_08760 [Candidatus Blautia faecavium]|uniref:Uncharacterized protein n=1 Tax=Candidatus Blautia faecavium TaxID=2838487 RepID=A0A9D2LSM7_9FIRM|nr:hypothetical protein [Candidatus Blautia faecavium]
MERKYPAEAFALGIFLFSTGMKEAFAAGILVILSVTAAQWVKELLEEAIPRWSLCLCVGIASGSLSASVFLLGFTVLGIGLTDGMWIMTFILGLFCAWYVLEGKTEGEYGELFYESGILWGLWVLLAAVREFMGTGAVFENLLYEGEFQSKAFMGGTFAFLTAALVLALGNGLLKAEEKNKRGFFILIPAVIFLRPFTMDRYGELIGLLWTAAVPLILFFSVKKILRFSRLPKAFRGLPADLMAMGFIYMILSVY